MLSAMQRVLVLGLGWLLCAQVVRAESFDQIVEAYGGAAAFDIILGAGLLGARQLVRGRPRSGIQRQALLCGG